MSEHTPAVVIEPEASELVISEMRPGSDIVANFDALRNHISRILEDYQGVTIAKDYVGQAKKDRAFLNGLSKALNQRRKEVKDQYMRPVVAFEEQVKLLDAPIRDASNAIDEQVKAFEEQEKAEKRAEIVKHWHEYAGALSDAVDFEAIENPAWLNKSVNLMAAFKEVEDIVNRIADAEQTLTDLNLSHPMEAKAEYFASLDLSKAIARSKQLDEMEERARALEAEKQAILAAREAARLEAEAAEPVAQAEPVAEAVTAPVAPVEDVAVEVTLWAFTFHGTAEQRDSVIAFLKSIGATGNVSRAKGGNL